MEKNELRKDYFLDRWVLITPGRAKRKKEFKSAQTEIQKLSYDPNCFFCPGNEKTTPPEIGRYPEKNKWQIRWFSNKFPAVSLKNPSAYGIHEVIVETPDHSKQLGDLSVFEIRDVLKIYRLREAQILKNPKIEYLVIFKNEGSEAGTSLVHSHSQLIGINLAPGNIKEEVGANQSKCHYCQIIKKEAKSPRKVFENKNFISFTPWASRFHYEVWIFPKKHLKNLQEMTDDDFKDLAEILKKILLKLKKINLSYNYFLHPAPKGKDLHFHLEITPREAKWGGFEISTGNVIINSVSPEEAAEFYRS